MPHPGSARMGFHLPVNRFLESPYHRFMAENSGKSWHLPRRSASRSTGATALARALHRSPAQRDDRVRDPASYRDYVWRHRRVVLQRVETSGSASSLILTMFCATNQAYFMGFFFLLAGYFTPPSLERKGYARFLGRPLSAPGPAAARVHLRSGSAHRRSCDGVRGQRILADLCLSLESQQSSATGRSGLPRRC